jgi:carboxypeptidase C (cathepsin A)
LYRTNLAATLLLVAALPSLAQKTPAPDAEKTAAPIPSETKSETSHTLQLEGKTIAYTAAAGTLLINGDDEKPNGSMFYVAYTLNGVSEPRTRPVTFLYNGGPGSASLWLHMASVGPVRVLTASPEATGAAPYRIVPNEYSLLDKTDLVFVDAMGTGFSRVVGKATMKDFAGTDQDARAFSKFIQRFLTVNHRWNSPKFLFGESYGTTRSAALVDVLEASGVSCNGVILMSTILNFHAVAPANDAWFIGNLPSYAAIAWHFEKVPHKGRDMKTFLNEARAFARGPYAEALAQGHNLPAAQADAIAAKMASLTGLSVQYLKEANLRVNPSRFRKELLRGQRIILGRYDARFEGTDYDAAGENPGYDPSSTGITGAVVSALHEYMDRELKYDTKESYYPRAPGLSGPASWDFSHRPGGAGGAAMRETDVVEDLADAMRKNPRLRIFSANGLFDLATPFFNTEYDLAHMQLEPKLRGNIEFGYYASGHMIYLNVDALKQLKADLAGFYQRAAGGGM